MLTSMIQEFMITAEVSIAVQVVGSGYGVFSASVDRRAMGSLHDDLGVEHIELRYGKVFPRSDDIAKSGVSGFVSFLKTRLKFRATGREFCHVKGFGHRVESSFVGPEFYVDRTRIAAETSDVQCSLGADDGGFVVVAGGVRSAQIEPTDGPAGSCETNVGGVPAFIDGAVVVFCVKHSRPNFVWKLAR